MNSPSSLPIRSHHGACLFVVVTAIALTSQVASVGAVVERNVAPTSNFTADVNAELAGAIADNYMIHLSAGLYTGCGTATIDLRPGSALLVTVIGAGEKETTIDCENVVLTSPVFTCGAQCTAVLQNVTVTRVRMTTASPNDVGALLNVLGGASMSFLSVNVTSCWTVTNGDALPSDLTNASSIVRLSGFGTRLFVIDSTFSHNTGEIGSISAVNYGQVSVSESHFESNSGGGGSPEEGLGGVFSFAYGATGDFSQSSFLSNVAIFRGGILYSFYGGDTIFVNVTTQESSAGEEGGVVWTYGGVVSFVDVTTQESSAGDYGGVVWSYGGGVVNFVNVTTQESSAANAGGVVFSYAGVVSFVDVNTKESSADYGGVVYADGGDVSFVNVITEESSAVYSGGTTGSDVPSLSVARPALENVKAPPPPSSSSTNVHPTLAAPLRVTDETTSPSLSFVASSNLHAAGGGTGSGSLAAVLSHSSESEGGTESNGDARLEAKVEAWSRGTFAGVPDANLEKAMHDLVMGVGIRATEDVHREGLRVLFGYKAVVFGVGRPAMTHVWGFVFDEISGTLARPLNCHS